MINQQAGFVVFGDMQDKKQRKACASHVASIIRCITPAADESKRMAAEAKKVVNQDLAFRRDFDAGVREVAAFHRQPLTEWETEQARLEAEQLAREEARLAAEKLELAHQDALDMDELITLRKAREAAVEQARLAAKAIEDKRLFDEAVAKQLEASREAIRAEELAKIEAAAKALLLENLVIEPVATLVLNGLLVDTKDADVVISSPIYKTEQSFKDDSKIIEPTIIKNTGLDLETRRRMIGALAFEFDCTNDQAIDLINKFNNTQELSA